jgi:hypothetical protein
MFFKLLDCNWIVNPFWKVGLDLDLDQSQICDGFGLDWQSQKIGLSKSLAVDTFRQITANTETTTNEGVLCARKNVIATSFLSTISSINIK